MRLPARPGVRVIWRCWQDGTGYDPAKHNALQETLARQATADIPQEEQ